MNRERYIEKKDEIKKLQGKIIKIDLGIQDIKQEITYIKIKQYDDNEKFEEAISQQSQNIRVVGNILQQVKSTSNQEVFQV